MAEDTTQNPGISRRDLIKRGAILGGAVAWATPVVQVVGMNPAFAQTQLVSPGGERCMTIRLYEDAQLGPNRYRYGTEVCNCGALTITGISVVTVITSSDKPVVGSSQVQTTGTTDLVPAQCEEQTFTVTFTSKFNVVAGQSLSFTMKATADDSFGPVSDTQSFGPYLIA